VTRKEKNKLVREIDKEGYFKFLLERDLKRRKFFGFVRFVKIFPKIFRVFTHLCFWIHWYEETHETVQYAPPDKNGIEYAQIWKCSICGAEATSKAARWELFKLIFGTLGIFLFYLLATYSTLPLIGLLNPTLSFLLLLSFPVGGAISILYRILAMKV
jgi:hypothetical protein